MKFVTSFHSNAPRATYALVMLPEIQVGGQPSPSQRPGESILLVSHGSMPQELASYACRLFPLTSSLYWRIGSAFSQVLKPPL